MWAFDFFEQFFIKTTPWDQKNGSNQVKSPWRQIVSNIRTSGRVFMKFTTL